MTATIGLAELYAIRDAKTPTELRNRLLSVARHVELERPLPDEASIAEIVSEMLITAGGEPEGEEGDLWRAGQFAIAACQRMLLGRDYLVVTGSHEWYRGAWGGSRKSSAGSYQARRGTCSGPRGVTSLQSGGRP